MAASFSTASTSIMPASAAITPLSAGVQRLPKVPWRDPHTVSPEELSGYIQTLEKSCLENPQSADLRTCLGMAYAMNFEVYKSMDALEAATAIDPENFWAHFKRAELHYRLRALPLAEEQTLHALQLAGSPWEASLARKQLQEIRRLRREGTRDVAWIKPLGRPVVCFAAMVVLMVVAMLWK
jgi:hypothetical protein